MAALCPLCFGPAEGAVGRGLLWGIFTLAVVTVAVLAGFASFFVRLARGEREAPAAPPAEAAGATGDRRAGRLEVPAP